MKALIRLRGCAVWSGPSLSAYARTHVFALGGPFVFWTRCTWYFFVICLQGNSFCDFLFVNFFAHKFHSENGYTLKVYQPPFKKGSRSTKFFPFRADTVSEETTRLTELPPVKAYLFLNPYHAERGVWEGSTTSANHPSVLDISKSINNGLVNIWATPCENVSSGYADSDGPDQPAHPRSLIRAVTAAHRTIGYYKMYE